MDFRIKFLWFSLVLSLVGLGSCRSPVLSNGAGGKSVRVVLPVAASASSSAAKSASGARLLLLPSGSWVSLSCTDGATTETRTATLDGSSSVSFEFTLQIGASYTFTAEAGTGQAGSGTVLFTGTASAVIGTSEITLYLKSVESSWTSVPADSDTLALPALADGAYATYRFGLGSHSRVYLPGVSSSLVIYVQNTSDGSPVSLAVNDYNELIVEDSQLSAGASDFLVTFSNTSGEVLLSDSLSLSYDPAYVPLGTLPFSGARNSMTHYGTTLYAADFGGNIISYDTSTRTSGTCSVSTAVSYPWGIATDGTSFYVAENVSTARIQKLEGVAGGTVTGYSNLVTTASLNYFAGCAVIGGNVYFSANSSGEVYKIAADAASTAITSLTPIVIINGAAGMCANGTDLYVVGTNSAMIYRIDTAAGTPAAVDFAETTGTGTNFCATDGTYLYYNEGTVLKRMALASTDSAASETVVDFSTVSPNSMDCVGDALYVVCDDNILYRFY